MVLAGCGGGGSSSPSTTATLKVATAGTLATGSSLYGIDITIRLPAGVTVATTAEGSVAPGVVSVSGVAVPGTAPTDLMAYTPATNAADATLRFVIVSSTQEGFGAGEFATVNCNLSAGITPKSSDFGWTAFSPADNLLQPVQGLTPAFTIQ